jgi:hypothetical protein
MAKKPRKTAHGGRKPHPKCKAILLCDQTIIEAGSGKISLIGIFEGFSLPAFPGRTLPIEAFVQLVDGIGNYDVVVEIQDLQTDEIVARSPVIEVNFPVRLAKVNLVIPIPPLNISHPGAYDFVVIADGQDVERQKFGARLPDEPEEFEHEE